MAGYIDNNSTCNHGVPMECGRFQHCWRPPLFVHVTHCYAIVNPSIGSMSYVG